MQEDIFTVIKFISPVKKIKMGAVYYYTTYYDTTIQIKKVMVTNFMNLSNPITQINFIDLNNNNEKINIILPLREIPIFQEKDDTIFLGSGKALCTNKQATFELIRKILIRGRFSIHQYLSKNYRSPMQSSIIEIYKNTIEYLKTL